MPRAFAASAVLALLTSLALGACAAPTGPDAVTDDGAEIKSLKGVTRAERAAYLRKAQVFLGGDVASKDLIRGPEGKDRFDFNEEVACAFVEPEEKNELNGNSRKFLCKLPSGDEVKVKYGETADDNGEVYGEVLTTRLLWALGFAADRMYPVRVTCTGCPADPWKAYKDFEPGKPPAGGPRETRRFATAVIEKKFEAAKIEEAGKEDQGWSWGEIDDNHANERAGGAPAAHISGFKLLAALVAHADNKAENQRLVCLPDGVTPTGKCDKPVLMIQDAGVSFGGAARLFGLVYDGRARARYEEWISVPVWKDRGACQADLRDAATGSMTNPHILEAGRRFLAERLMQLTDAQIRDLFVVSRVEERGEMIDDLREGAPSSRRKVTVEDWRAAFAFKRDEIARHTCKE